DDADAFSLQRGDCGNGAELTQPLAGACRELEPGWITSIDDVDVMVPRHDQDALGELRMAGEHVKELGPFRGPAGVGDVSADQNDIDGCLAVQRLELRKGTGHAAVAPRTRAAAFDAPAEALSDEMQVGQMRDAPGRAILRRRIEFLQVPRL